MKKLHLINDKGEQVSMPWNKLKTINEDKSTHDKYMHDVDWYLNNGYSSIDDVINELEDIV